MYRELLHVHMAANDHDGLLRACAEFGTREGGDPALWNEALEYFSRAQGDVSAEVAGITEFSHQKFNVCLHTTLKDILSLLV